MTKKILVLVGAFLVGGLTTAPTSILPQAAEAGFGLNWHGQELLALVSAFLAGGLGIAVTSLLPQAAEAGIRMN